MTAHPPAIHRRPVPRALAAALALLAATACARGKDEYFRPDDTATAETVDKVTFAASQCAGIRPDLARALADDRITKGEVRAIAVRAARLAYTSDLADSYAEARRVSGQPPARRGPPCNAGELVNFLPG